MLLMYGSSIFIIHVTDKFMTEPRLWTGPYLFPGTFAVTAGMSTAGTLTRWFRDNLAKDLVEIQEKTGRNTYDLLADEASGIAPGSEGLIVLPYFSGERTPINDPDAKGVIFGLTLKHSRAHMYNACLEGIGYGIAQHFDIFDRMGMDTKKIMAVGGGVKNEKWLQIVSNISGRAQSTVVEGIGAAYGDALLAALSIGHYKDFKDIGRIISHRNSIVPQKEEQAKYAIPRRIYEELYISTRRFMHEL
jgi:xylulokinase